MKYSIRYGTGAGDKIVSGTLEDAKQAADDGASYTCLDYGIYVDDEFVTYRKWRSGGFDADLDECTEDEILRFGDMGYYAPWSDEQRQKYWDHRDSLTALAKIYEETRTRTPKETMEALVQSMGQEKALRTVAELVNTVGDWDERIAPHVRKWAAGREDAWASERLIRHSISAPSTIHPAHICQLGMEAEKFERYIREGTFFFGGFHFTPVGQFAKGEGDFFAVSKRIESDRKLGLSTYEEWQKFPYSYDGFYAASTEKTCDIFLCEENGRLYVPGENELFLYHPPDKEQKNVREQGKAHGKINGIEDFVEAFGDPSAAHGRSRDDDLAK